MIVNREARFNETKILFYWKKYSNLFLIYFNLTRIESIVAVVKLNETYTNAKVTFYNEKNALISDGIF